MEINQETNEQEMEEQNATSKLKQWFQDNMRIIISILIVILIAGGIYSYSKRSEELTLNEEIAATEETKTDSAIKATEKETSTEGQKADQDKTAPISISQETEKSFIETAAKGDSQTRLARKALANFLEKNPDSSLKAEHKIYIEDYLRKNAGHKGSVMVGTSIEFSKDLIKDAIAKSKTLNEKQLQNLHKYAVRVPSLS